MKTKVALCSVLMLVAIAAMSYRSPEGWIKAGSKPGYYDMGTDVGAGRNGGNAATIQSIHKKVHGFGTLMQNIEPGIYRGKRLKLTGYVKTEDVNSWAGMWLRVDGKVIGKAVTTTVKRNGDTRKVTSSTHDKELKKTLAFDNMSNRALTGTTGWTRCEIVLDVADSATNIAFGVLLNGTGQLWFDDLKFDIVNTDVPTTGGRNKEPLNLDFEK